MSDITAARINNLQSRIELILGTGAGQNGYGQSISSSSVDPLLGIIQAEDLNNIYTDALAARIHQVGYGDVSIAEVVQNLNIVAEETSNFIDDAGIISTDPDGTKKGIADFERLMSNIEADRFLVSPTQASVESAISSTRTSAWNGLIYHEVTVTFADADHRRYFFNTGGELRFTPSNNSARSPKGEDWYELCDSIGTVKFNYNSTVPTGSGAGQSIGNYQLTTSYQTVFRKIGTGTVNSVYAGNIFTIKAKQNSNNIIMFRIEFEDAVFDNRIDNNVEGTLKSTVEHYRADSEFVSVAAPSYFNNHTLA